MPKMVHRRVLLGSGLSFAVLGALGGCKGRDPDAPAAKQGKAISIAVAIENDIQTLDPTNLSDPHTSRIVWQLYEGLVGLNEDGSLRPVLAESWTHSDDFKRWSFKIRDGVNFHRSGTTSGSRTLTAADVVFSYQRFAKGFGSFVFSGLVAGFDDFVNAKSTAVSGFTAADPRSFVIDLLRPDPSFLYRISSPYLGVMQREVVEAAGDAFGVSVAAGTGPFRLISRTSNEVVLARNDAYWGSRAGNIDQVVFRVEKSAQLRMSQAEAGTYDIAQVPSTHASRYFEGATLRPEFAAKMEAYLAKTYNVHYLGIDNRQLGDVHLRKAIAQSVDKSAIARSVLRGMADPASGPFPPYMLAIGNAEALPFDLQASKRELAMSGKRPKNLSLLATAGGSDELVAQLVQSNLRAIGIDVSIELTDFNSLISRVFGAKRPPLFLLHSEWIFGAPELLLDVFDSRKYPNPNMFAYSSPSVDAEISSAQALYERAAINSRTLKITARANADAPAVWLYHEFTPYLLTRRVKGFSVNQHQHWKLANVTVT